MKTRKDDLIGALGAVIREACERGGATEAEILRDFQAFRAEPNTKEAQVSRSVRKVPADWQHPYDERRGRHVPLHDGYEADLARFAEEVDDRGLGEALDDWGGGPVSEQYMLVGVPAGARTHLMMYETTSEGTPISPAFSTPEELARWLADTGASSLGGQTATYEQWLATCLRGWAPSAVGTADGLVSGVEALEARDLGR